jgi:GxxExxY protein
LAENATFCRDRRDFLRFLAGVLFALADPVMESNSLYEDLTEQIIACAITVHDTLGPGLLESIYQRCLTVELNAASLPVETERSVSVAYRGTVVGPPLKVDLVVAGLVVVEVKAVHSFAPVHHAQVISYLKLTGCPVGLLLNFNVTLLKHGIRKVVRPDLYKKKTPVSPVSPV